MPRTIKGKYKKGARVFEPLEPVELPDEEVVDITVPDRGSTMKSRSSQARTQAIFVALFAIMAVLAATDVVSSELYSRLLPFAFIIVGLSMIYTVFYLPTFYRRLFRVMFGVGLLLLAAPMLLPVGSRSTILLFLGSIAGGVGAIGVAWYHITDMSSDVRDRG